MRNDFRLGIHSYKKQVSKVLGLIIADLLRYIIEKGIDVNDAFNKTKIDNFMPERFVRKKKKIEYLKMQEMREQLMNAWNNCNGDQNVAKEDYIESLAGNNRSDLLPDYHVEKYKALLDNHQKVIVEFHPHINHDLVVRTDAKKSISLCSIQELCFVSVQMAKNTVEISRKNGIPHYFSFESESQLKSFVSLLDGYYRLSEKWSFSICKEISSPSLSVLKSHKCHGPVGLDFASGKLRKKSQAKDGAYLIRESTAFYDQLKIDILTPDDDVLTFAIEKTSGGYLSDASNHSCPTLSDVLQQFSKRFDLKHCLQPSEYDQSDVLLLCRNEKSQNEFLNDTQTIQAHQSPNHTQPSPSAPIVIYSQDIIKHTPLHKSIRYPVTRGTLNKKEVFLKAVSDEKDVSRFLRIINQWISVKNECIVSFLGVTLDTPLSLVMEYLPLGPLDEFIILNKSELKPVDLIESTTYFSRALWYLEEKNLVHGSIRCHNLLVSSFNPSSLKVKLSDPLSIPDLRREAPWISPEVRRDGLEASSSSSDVWAFGTSLWEIFSYGLKPDSEDVGSLLQPMGCPPDVWDLIQECWRENFEERKQPQSIVRDLSQILYEVYNSRRVNAYSTIDEDKTHTKHKQGFIRSVLGSSANISRSSIMSTRTELTGLDYSSRSDLLSLYSRNNEELTSPSDSETWIIEANQLSPLESGKILGQVSLLSFV